MSDTTKKCKVDAEAKSDNGQKAPENAKDCSNVLETQCKTLEAELASARTALKQATEILQCPINQEVMLAPVSLACSHTYEYSALKKWLVKHPTCPMCRKPVDRKSDDLSISLAHVSLREALLPNQKIDWSAVEFPAGSNRLQFLKMVPAAAALPAAGGASASSVNNSSPSAADVLRTILLRRQELAEEVKIAAVWAKSFYADVVLPRIQSYVKDTSPPLDGIWHLTIYIHAPSFIDGAQLEALAKLIRGDFEQSRALTTSQLMAYNTPILRLCTRL